VGRVLRTRRLALTSRFSFAITTHYFVGLYLHNKSTYRQSEKNLLSSNISSTCRHNKANLDPLTADISSGVWGTPANVNWFRILALLLQRRRSPEANQTLHDVWPSPGLVHYTACPQKTAP